MKSAVSHSDLTNQQHLQRVTGRGGPALSEDRKGVWPRERKCMEAKALQTIDTLYITRYSYNNIAGTYCTDKIELYGWRKLLVYSIQQTGHSYPDLLNLLFFFNLFSFNPSSLFPLINSSQVSIYMYIAEHTHVHIHSHMLTNYTKIDNGFFYEWNLKKLEANMDLNADKNIDNKDKAGVESEHMDK